MFQRFGSKRQEVMKRAFVSTVMAAILVLTTAMISKASVSTGTIGHGFGPGLAVDAAGTAYIAWSGPENPAASLQFCRLPRGATKCDIAHAIAAPGTTTSRAFVTVSGSRVVVVQYRYPFTGTDVAGVYEFVSTDGGKSFGAGRVVGTIPFFEAVAGPGDTLSGVTDAVTGGMQFQNVPLGGGAAATSANLSVDHPYRGTVGLVDAATPLTVFTNGSDAARFRRYDGSGSLNDVSNWTRAGRSRRGRLSEARRRPERALPAGEHGEQHALRPQVERNDLRAAGHHRRRRRDQPSEPARLPGRGRATPCRLRPW